MPAAAAERYADCAEVTLVSLARAGDRAAFAELVRRRQSWIRNLMRRLSGDPVLADDLAQQAFLTAFERLGQLRRSDRFGAWLKRIAVTAWLQHARGHARGKDPLDAADELTDTEFAAERRHGLKIDLERALSLLPAAQRLCVVLSYHEGMAHGEIAQTTGLPLGTVKSHVRRGAERLRRVLASYEIDEPEVKHQ